MKKHIYISAMLAVIIHVVVQSQPIMNEAFQHDKNFVLGYAYFTEEERRAFSMVDDPSVLIIQAAELSKRAGLMKKEASLKRGEEQKRMDDQAEDLLKKADTKRLAAAELLAYNNRMEFKAMKNSLISMFDNYNAEDGFVISAKGMLLKAVRFYRAAVELREEAYAQRTTSGILANLHNAEERETQALIQLVGAMNELEKAVPQVVATR
ncbi:MAG: hypothetical protein ACJ77K_10190 [Bacteroidia bacterium]